MYAIVTEIPEEFGAICVGKHTRKDIETLMGSKPRRIGPYIELVVFCKTGPVIARRGDWVVRREEGLEVLTAPEFFAKYVVLEDRDVCERGKWTRAS